MPHIYPNSMRIRRPLAAWAVLAILIVLATGTRGEETTRDRSARAELAARAAELEKQQAAVTRGQDDWLFLPHELAHYGCETDFWTVKPPNPKQVNPMDAIVAFKDNLAMAGVELILVPVPGKVVIYSERLVPPLAAPSGTRLDAMERRFYDALAARGVTVVDMTPEFMELKAKGVAPFCRQDSHYSPAGQQAVARTIAALIRGRPWYAGAAKVTVGTSDLGVEVTGDLALLAKADVPKERLTVRQVKVGGAFINDPELDGPRRASPLVLIGDSHCLVYGDRVDLLADNADLGAQLTAETALLVDVVANKGSGVNAPRITLLNRKDKMAGKRCVVWVFSARSFTRAVENWRTINVVR
ncbi:MAG: hypothetical protein K8S99_13015 [Planctomycetes bacterium]|nr:hypothetical protein [Planctomycetota bacterium]